MDTDFAPDVLAANSTNWHLERGAVPDANTASMISPVGGSIMVV
jgi:hypothetical protein